MNFFTKCAFARGIATHPRFVHIFTARVYREGGKVALRGEGGREGQNRVDSQPRRSFRGLIGNNHAVSGLGKSCGFRPLGKSWLVGFSHD